MKPLWMKTAGPFARMIEPFKSTLAEACLILQPHSSAIFNTVRQFQ
jgi:hypothetical protein